MTNPTTQKRAPAVTRRVHLRYSVEATIDMPEATFAFIADRFNGNVEEWLQSDIYRVIDAKVGNITDVSVTHIERLGEKRA